MRTLLKAPVLLQFMSARFPAVQTSPPAWWADALREGVRLSGAVLAGVGLPLPVLAPAQGFLLHLT